MERNVEFPARESFYGLSRIAKPHAKHALVRREILIVVSPAVAESITFFVYGKQGRYADFGGLVLPRKRLQNAVFVPYKPPRKRDSLHFARNKLRHKHPLPRFQERFNELLRTRFRAVGNIYKKAFRRKSGKKMLSRFSVALRASDTGAKGTRLPPEPFFLDFDFSLRKPSPPFFPFVRAPRRGSCRYAPHKRKRLAARIFSCRNPHALP